MGWAANDKYLWDSWFVHDQNGRLHAFYLQCDKSLCNFIPSNRHELAEVGHAIYTDAGWKAVSDDFALAASRSSWDNTSIWTGSVFYDRETNAYRMFYTSRDANSVKGWTPRGAFVPQQIGLAVSTDLLSWRRTEETLRGPVIANFGEELGLDGVNWRDPYVTEYGGRYLCLISAHANPGGGIAEESGGAIVLLESPSLDDWTFASRRVLVLSNEFYQLEVPQLLWRREGDGLRFFLVFCAQSGDCSAVRKQRFSEAECATGTYVYSSALCAADCGEIPSFEESPRLLAPDIYAGKIIDFEGEPCLIGFDYKGGEDDFVGGISRPLPVQFAEGGLVKVR